MKKKVLALLLATAMIATFAGCGKDDTTVDSGNDAPPVEDEGEGVCFNVFAYNVQPLITINYSDGTSFETPREPSDGDTLYILNTKSKKFHLPSCSSSKSMSEKNKDEFTGDRSELIAMGYTPCGECDP